MAIDATPDSLAARLLDGSGTDGGSVGHSARSRVTLVHGFAQNSACIGPLADAVAEVHEVVAVDAPGHGGSLDHLDADLGRGAELLVATGGPGDYIGYSMGGRLCLHTAVHHPEVVERLVLISTTAGIEDARARAERAEWDERHAARLEEIGLDAFIEEWLALPLFTSLPSWARFDDERRANAVAGLAASLRRAGTGSMDPLWDDLPGLSCPVLIVTGIRDERYTELGERMADAIGDNAHLVTIAGAGHSTHLEQPSPTAQAVLEFLAG